MGQEKIEAAGERGLCGVGTIPLLPILIITLLHQDFGDGGALAAEVDAGGGLHDADALEGV